LPLLAVAIEEAKTFYLQGKAAHLRHIRSASKDVCLYPGARPGVQNGTECSCKKSEIFANVFLGFSPNIFTARRDRLKLT